MKLELKLPPHLPLNPLPLYLAKRVQLSYISGNNPLNVKQHLFHDFLSVYLFSFPDVVMTSLRYFVCRFSHVFQNVWRSN